MTVASVCSWNGTSCTSTYAPAIQYDAAGRVDLLKLGGTEASPALLLDDSYYAWNTQGGRLSTRKAGTPANPTSLQDFEYDYDLVGNIGWIKDKNAGGTQTQTFHSDALDRLVDAEATGGTGGTYAKQDYTYDTSSGDLSSKAGSSLGYSASVTCAAGTRTLRHAVSSYGSNTYSYDCNGSQTTRVISDVGSYNLTYDAENRLTAVSGAVMASFVYDGNGQRVKGTVGGVTTTYIGNYAEWDGSSITRYYYAGTLRIAINKSGTLSWLLGDHLGSTSITAASNGTKNSEVRCTPWGRIVLRQEPLPQATDIPDSAARWEALGCISTVHAGTILILVICILTCCQAFQSRTTAIPPEANKE